MATHTVPCHDRLSTSLQSLSILTLAIHYLSKPAEWDRRQHAAQTNTPIHACMTHVDHWYFETSTVAWTPMHLVPVLWVHVYFINEVTCHLTVTKLGCHVQHGRGVVCLLMDSFSKLRQQELDDLNVPTCWGAVHGIQAHLHHIQVQDINCMH